MKVKHYTVYADIMNLLMIELFYVTAAWYLLDFLLYPVTPGLPFAFGVILTGSYFVRKYIRKLYIYILVHVFAIILLLCLPLRGVDGIMILGFAVLWTILNFVYWADEERTGIGMLPGWLVLLFPFVLVRAAAMESFFMGNVAYAGGIIYMGLYFLRLYCLNVKRFSGDKQMHEQVPVALMFAQNGKMIAVIVTCFVVGMLLLRSQLLIDGLLILLEWIREGIQRFLAWVVSLLPEDLLEMLSGQQNGAQAQLPVTAMEETPLFWKMLLYVAEVIVKWTITFGILYWAGKGIWQFYIRYRRREPRETEEICYDGIRETKSWIIRDRTSKQRGLLQNLTNAEKVRRLYRKRVEQFVKSGYPFMKAHTPQERAEDIHHWKGTEAAMEELTQVYETARYSTHEISAEDVRRVK